MDVLATLRDVREGIETQRQMLLSGKWVQSDPGWPGEACLMLHMPHDDETCELVAFWEVSDCDRWEDAEEVANRLLAIAIGRVYPVTDVVLGWRFVWNSPTAWNDIVCPSVGVALEVLDEAAAICKQAIADLEEEA